MNEFAQRYKTLNPAQKQAVDSIDGPLMVVAGPGTGKTELLSMRAANILQKTDTLPENILCLTFTESGANAMRERLTSIIGADAYKVAIHTFHSFGSEIINQNRQFFYGGAEFRPADELSSYEILRDILDELPFDNPLASKMNGEYTHLGDILTTISELKKSGLTSDELLKIIDSNEQTLDTFEERIAEIFGARVSKSTITTLQPLSLEIAEYTSSSVPPNITPLANTLALSLAHSIDEAEESGSTKPITAWKNKWCEKNEQGKTVFKDRKRHEKLRAVSYVYFQYLNRMQEAALYDFDDMVLRVVHALEVFPELRYNLQEKYLYIMVDEFQDTNLAQARILTSLTALETGDAPNIMVVGDDDQAIYSFQGAEVRNIMHFKQQYEGAKLVVLTDNYRSTETILTHSRSVITLGTDRLETYVDELDKTLTAHTKATASQVTLHEYATASDERTELAKRIKKQIEQGTAPEEIAVLARRHHELEALLPYFHHQNIAVNYERRDNVLELDSIRHLTLLATIIMLLAEKRIGEADELLPELLAHPAWGFSPQDIWKLSLAAYKNHSGWCEEMAVQPRFITLHEWLITMAQKSLVEPAEKMLDMLTGTSKQGSNQAAPASFDTSAFPAAVTQDKINQLAGNGVEKEVGAADCSTQPFISPLYNHYFSEQIRKNDFETYLTHLEALRAIRTKLHEYRPTQLLLLEDFVEFIELHQQQGSHITSVRARSNAPNNAVQLMTAHKSKGLEYNHVYIVGAIDTAWGEKVRSRSRLISYPENLPLSPSGDTLDERLRLFFVAMTRARHTLDISYSKLNDVDKPTLPASFLVNDTWQATEQQVAKTQADIANHLQREWYEPYVSLPSRDMKQLLGPTLERYKLSATHLNAFLDIPRGGPQSFLLQNLLRFPQAMSPNAAYGSSIHRTLQNAHTHLQATGAQKPLEDVLGDFETNLKNAHLNEGDYSKYLQRGLDALSAFLGQHYSDFTQNDVAELSFAGQQSRVGEAHLTGALDVVRLDPENKTITVTDYKTGAPSSSWTGKTDYEKQKLHKYRQQLMFYKLLVEHSRDFAGYTVEQGVLQFVEPTRSGQIHQLSLTFSPDEMTVFTRLVLAVWQRIQALDLPDISEYSADYKGMQAFEAWLLDEYK